MVVYTPDGSGGVDLFLRRRTPLDEIDNEPLLSEGEQARWRGLADRYFFAAGAAAVAAAALTIVRRQRAALLLIMAGVGWTLFFGFIPPSTRFHFALGPVISVLAGAFVIFAWDGARARPRASRDPVRARWAAPLRAGRTP